MSTITTTAPARNLPRLGGFSVRMIGLELRRLLRNRRTVIFTFVMPPVFFFLFGTSGNLRNQSAGDGNATAYVLISMAVYGAMLATTSGGAMVSIERAAGWSRQLRLTPLKPLAYVATKLLIAMIIGLGSAAETLLIGSFAGARMPVADWLSCGLLAWTCSLVFAAFGLFMGYLLPSENVMQILGPVLALLSFAGGLFVPLQLLPSAFRTFAQFTPVYGVGVLARYPLTHEGTLWLAALNVAAWTTIFAVGAMWRFRRDTARV